MVHQGHLKKLNEGMKETASPYEGFVGEAARSLDTQRERVYNE